MSDKNESLNNARHALANAQSRAATRLEWMERIFGRLPDSIPAPTMSNEGKPYAFGGRYSGAVLSWGDHYGIASRYGQPNPKGSEILAALEGAGFRPLPACFAKYGQWRGREVPGPCDLVPEACDREPLKDCSIIAPLWLDLGAIFGGSESASASAFYLAPDESFAVAVQVPAPRAARVTGDVKPGNFGRPAGWRNARVIFPDAWQVIFSGDEATAQRAATTRAHFESADSLSAVLHWEMNCEPDEFMSPAAMLAILEGGA